MLPIVIGSSVIHYRGFSISSDDDVNLIQLSRLVSRDSHMELFIILEESHFNSGRSDPDPAHVGMSLLERFLTFEVASPMPNKNIQTKNTNDFMGDPSFAQLAMQIGEPFLQYGLIAG